MMARYGDLYTPASNYGQVYRGSLASRQKSVEQAGQNMKDFAGEIYNLVDRQRQRKAQEQEAQSLERERRSLQNSRKVRNQLAREEQDLNLYTQKLRNAVSLYKDEENRLESKRYKRYGSREKTAKAYDERYGKFTEAMATALDDRSRRAVLHEFRDLITEFQGVEGIDVLNDKEVSGKDLLTFRPMSKELFLEKELDKTVGKNQFHDMIRALLKHPTYGIPDAMAEAEKLSQDANPVSVQEKIDTNNLALGKFTVDGPKGTYEGQNKPVGELEDIRNELDIAAKGGSKEEEVIEEPVVVEEEVEPGFVYQDYTAEQGEELRSKVASKYRWFNSTSEKRQDAVSQMMAIIGFYLQQMGEEDTPDARIAEFDKMPKTRSLIEDVNSTPESIFNEFKRHSGFKQINKDDRPLFNEMLNDLSSTLRTGLSITYASPENKYTTEQMVDDGGKVVRFIFGEKQKSRKKQPKRNSSL